MKKLFTILLLTFTVSTAFSQMSREEVEFMIKDVFPEGKFPNGTLFEVTKAIDLFYKTEVSEGFKLELKPSGVWFRAGSGTQVNSNYVSYHSIGYVSIRKMTNEHFIVEFVLI
jgi:hypothetical protein